MDTRDQDAGPMVLVYALFAVAMGFVFALLFLSCVSPAEPSAAPREADLLPAVCATPAASATTSTAGGQHARR